MIVGGSSMMDMMSFLMRHVAPDRPFPARIPKMINFFMETSRNPEGGWNFRLDKAAIAAEKCGFPRACGETVRTVMERWNGSGHTQKLRSAFIPLGARIISLTQTAEHFFSLGGPRKALQVVRERSGKWFDPDVVRAFEELGQDESFWQDVAREDLKQLLLQMEPPNPCAYIDEARLDDVIDAFAEAVDVKSPFTGNHSRGVATIAEGLARKLGMSEEQARDTRRAALLHDLGKMGVSNAILDKPAKLNDSEWERMHLHTHFTQRILEDCTLLKSLAPISGSHHERMDGRGYHRQLKGDLIPPEARVLAVADVFHALSEDRPYRKGLATEQIVDIIKKEAGDHLDSTVCDALVASL